MAFAYSQDLRDRVLAAYDRGMQTNEIARTFFGEPGLGATGQAASTREWKNHAVTTRGCDCDQDRHVPLGWPRSRAARCHATRAS